MTAPETLKDERHTTPWDNHKIHIWVIEPPVEHGVLTQDGVTQIAEHKYVPGTYTFLDNLINPVWQFLTDLLPLWMAPNLVTALGCSCGLLAYLVTAWYSFDLLQPTPSWVLVFNGLGMFAYYTLDCMDGKQARRTNSSSPLGQLFDHGVDCVSNLFHMSLMQSVLQLSARHYLLVQACMQLGFFVAQWEEYYTGKLQHAAGNLGTTEVLYFMAIWSTLTGLGVWSRDFYDERLPGFLQETIFPLLPGHGVILGSDVMDGLVQCTVRHAVVLGWVYGLVVLFLLSCIRTITSIIGSPSLIVSALSKLITPFLLFAMCVVVSPLAPSLGGIRFPSLSIGLLFCIVTIKLVVYGMARMAYASLQVDIVPMLLIVMFQTQFPVESQILFPLATLLYLVRLVFWTHSAVDALCERLGIELFRIKMVKPEKDS